MSEFRVILASNSPRRRQLMRLTGLNFTIRPASIDETPISGEHPGDYVTRLARGKVAAAAAGPESPVEIYLGADTTVADGLEIMGKPVDASDAVRMLRQLRGKEHAVYTAIALRDPQTEQIITDLCLSRVPMRAYTDAEIEHYVATGDPLDKAGAYAIQHPAFHPVENFQGCCASVMGLPLCHLERNLRQMGAPSKADVPAACQAALHYDCPIYPAILRGKAIG
jgi:septum formation protein